MPGKSLKGKNVLITGGASGLGLVMARKVVMEGARVIITDINEKGVEQAAEELSSQSDFDVIALKHDVGSEESWEEVHSRVSSEVDCLHGLVNNAGIMPHIPFPMTTYETFKSTQKINVDSVFLGAQIFLPMLKSAGDGDSAASIVNVSSIFGGQVAGPLHSAYCTSKGAITALTKSIPTELPRMGYNVRCNSIHPGIMDVGVSSTGMEALVNLGQFPDVETALDYFAAQIPIGRPGKAEEIADGVIYLLSPQSSLMTGAELVLDGGYVST